VRGLVSGADDVRCVHVRSLLTRCAAPIGHRRVGQRAWRCAFALAVAYAGRESCWSDAR